MDKACDKAYDKVAERGPPRWVRPRPPGGECMRFLRHLGRLLKELLGFAWQNKAWWIVPIVLVLLLLTFLIFATEGVAPFIYTLF